MQFGIVGLGRMGGNMTKRALRIPVHQAVVYDRDSKAITELVAAGATGAYSLDELVEQLQGPRRVVWVMLPAGDATQRVIEELGALLSPGDVVVNGANSRWTDDQQYAEYLTDRGIGFVDAGVSGGVWGLHNGYALMVGGAPEDIELVQPLFDALKPAGDHGFVHAGAVGAGHFAKMVHNGIEYAMMQAFAEGWELLEAAPEVTDVLEVFRSWRQGTVIRSWLLDLAVAALDDDEHLEGLRGYADDSGEGRWTIEAAIDHAVPLPAITAALFARFASRQPDSPAMKMVAALRNQFGGHAVKHQE